MSKIAADYKIELQQERANKFRDELLKKARNPEDHRAIVDYHDEETLLHTNHMERGFTPRRSHCDQK